MTICHVAETLGLHPSRISRLETGAAQPAADEVIEYFKALGSEAAALYRDILAARWIRSIGPIPGILTRAPSSTRWRFFRNSMNRSSLISPFHNRCPVKPSSFVPAYSDRRRISPTSPIASHSLEKSEMGKRPPFVF